MIRFSCDYQEGAHPRLLQRLAETNLEAHPGYGEDGYCQEARQRIKELCQAPGAEVHFLVGGTQANLTVISGLLRPHQGVLAAKSGHIAVHETGAVEATGHKVLELPPKEGKIAAAQVREAVRRHWSDPTHEHMVQPGMVYISQPTEVGALYSLAELEELSRACRELGLSLFVDGARLAYALASPTNEASLADLARLTDVFYIGGTKCGALFGEAVVITHPGLQQDFRYLIKQRGGLLAKGRLLGVQFGELFRDGLYEEIGRRGVEMAARVTGACVEKGLPLLAETHTNQVFPILAAPDIEKLERKYAFERWEPWDKDHWAVRFVTSWATREEDVERLIADIAAL